MIFYVLIALPVVLYLFRTWTRYRKYYSQGLDGPRALPIFGNFFQLLIGPFAQYEANNFRKYGRTYVDYILDPNGVITTSNVDHVKKILVKDFHCFSHRLQPIYMPKYARKAVIFQNEDWKRKRSQVTPVFTSGRLKLMYRNFKTPVEQTLHNIDALIDKKQNEAVDVKKLMRAFSLDMISNVVFSLQTDSYNKNSDFAQKVHELFEVNLISILFFVILPKSLQKLLHMTFIKKEPTDYFAKLTLNLIEDRKKNKEVVYNDFIELLLKSKADGEVEKNFEEDGHIVRKLSTEEIVGQCFIFFVAGLETVGTSLSLLLYELALNQSIQDKLYQDLIACHPDDDLSFEDINKSKYLDCVLNEALRKHSTLSRIFRIALTDYDFGDFKVTKGQSVGVSLANLHNDEQLFNEPHKFKPERFLTGELANNSGFQPIPFVDGPRNCIGNRFAMIEMKSLLIPLIKRFRIFATAKTDIPLKYQTATLLNMVKDVTLGFERRN